MKWRQPLLVLFVLGLLISTLTLGPWGGLFYLLFALKFILLLAEFTIAVAPLWLLRRQVQRDIVDPSGAVHVGMRWWFGSYVALCVFICWLPWLRPIFISNWVQYLLAAFVTAIVGATVFALKWRRNSKQVQKEAT